jgi:phosphomethylpyrimidine synthase
MKIREEIIPFIKLVAKKEEVPIKTIYEEIEKGSAIIPANIKHRNIDPIIIGKRFTTKINANIGTSKDMVSIKKEKEKLKVAIKFGADTIMDLSTGGNLDLIRNELISISRIPFGTVPVYQLMVEKDIKDITEKDFIDVILKHAQQGVDFVTVHAGVTKKSIPLIKKRTIGVVSRGGAFILSWMKYHNKDNPLYTHFDEILSIANEFNLTLSLGDGLRPGCIQDATDDAQIHELKIIGELTKRAMSKNVQVMVEGPGHIPIDQIKKNVEMQQKICHNAPFYVLGPIVTDIGAGYDHIVGAMGGLIAAYYGASLLCYVTPKEHLGIPDIEDVKQGVIAFKIAAHAADVGKGIKKAKEWDYKMTLARKCFKWAKQFSLSIDPFLAKRYHNEIPSRSIACSMCSEYCPMKFKV